MYSTFKRILYKVSGEAMMGQGQFGHDFETMKIIAEDIKNVYNNGTQIALVIGGGNICRGETLSAHGMERAVGDYMGMLATVMNAIAMQNILERHLNIPTRVLSALPINSICETYIRRRAIRHMEKNRIVIFAAGTGNPFFTTDSGAALRAIEMNCDALFKGTSVDGVYSADPKKDPLATRYETVDHTEVLNKNLRFMDPSAIAMARDHKLPIVVFSIKDSLTPLGDAMKNKQNSTLVKS